MNNLSYEELIVILTALECFMDVYQYDELYGIVINDLISKLEGLNNG